ncbi:MAG: GtrA family protein [Anaerolineae bacterium]|nr:GtrA family protein [Anaerolineae bacterium]MCX8068703.1 GtrA family protein [Anaerolineae bacterium]MDW7991228.1 GtrA family protein [Anaerolineae bacterium]
MTSIALVSKVRTFLQDNRKEVVRFLKFSIVGALGAVVDFGILYLLHIVAGLHIVPANTCSFTAAVLSNFTWNRYWTYPDSRSKPLGKQLTQFFIVNIAGWGINTGILVLLRYPCVTLVGTVTRSLTLTLADETLYKLGYNLAKAIATGIVLFWNFFVNRFWTYSDVS